MKNKITHCSLAYPYGLHNKYLVMGFSHKCQNYQPMSNYQLFYLVAWNKIRTSDKRKKNVERLYNPNHAPKNCTQRNLFGILLNQTDIRLYLPCTY